MLMAAGGRISMDGRGRWMDNVFIERLRALAMILRACSGHGDRGGMPPDVSSSSRPMSLRSSFERSFDVVDQADRNAYPMQQKDQADADPSSERASRDIDESSHPTRHP
jgi:hypothetical protein